MESHASNGNLIIDSDLNDAAVIITSPIFSTVQSDTPQGDGRDSSITSNLGGESMGMLHNCCYIP